MTEFVTAISTAVSPTALYGALAGLATFIGGIAVFAFGNNKISKITVGASKGKLRM